MRIVLFTYPRTRPDEVPALLSAAGLVDALHIRKMPGTPRSAWRTLLDAVGGAYSGRIWLHDHYDLGEREEVTGLHLTSEYLQNAGTAPGLPTHLLTSATCRDPKSIPGFDGRFDRVFLAPMFESISKPGHGPTFDPESVRLAGMKSEWIALGGIDAVNAAGLPQCGFDGVAILGSFWQAEDPGKFLHQLRQVCTTTATSAC